MIACLLFAVLFAICSVALFMEKGTWLIAGYNTLSEEDKKKYDEKKLCKITGFICLVSTAWFCVMTVMCI